MIHNFVTERSILCRRAAIQVLFFEDELSFSVQDNLSSYRRYNFRRTGNRILIDDIILVERAITVLIGNNFLGSNRTAHEQHFSRNRELITRLRYHIRKKHLIESFSMKFKINRLTPIPGKPLKSFKSLA